MQYLYNLSDPNPFNPSTSIEFSIPQSDEVSLIVYDMLGREVAVLVSDKLSAGNYKVQYNAAEKLSSGVYIYRLKTNSYESTLKSPSRTKVHSGKFVFSSYPPR